MREAFKALAVFRRVQVMFINGYDKVENGVITFLAIRMAQQRVWSPGSAKVLVCAYASYNMRMSVMLSKVKA